MTANDPSDLVAELLGKTGTRLAHSVGVARRAEQLTTDWTTSKRKHVTTAAYLHDIGYSSKCRRTGWHPYDGALWLADNGYDLPLCQLVLWHTASWHEGRLRGLLDTAVTRFGPPDTNSIEVAVLTASDLLTGPTGQPLTIDERVDDIKNRYSSESVVARALTKAETDMRCCVKRALAQVGCNRSRESTINTKPH